MFCNYKISSAENFPEEKFNKEKYISITQEEIEYLKTRTLEIEEFQKTLEGKEKDRTEAMSEILLDWISARPEIEKGMTISAIERFFLGDISSDNSKEYFYRYLATLLEKGSIKAKNGLLFLNN